MAHAARHPRHHHHHHPRKPATLHPGKGQQKGKGPRKLHVHHHPKVHKGHAKRKHHHLKHRKKHQQHHLKHRQHHRHLKHHHKRHLKHHPKHRHHRRHHPATRYAKVTAYRGQQATPVAAHHIHQVQLHPVKAAKAAHRPHNGTSHYAQAGAGQRPAYRGKAYGQHVRNARKLGKAGMI